MFSNFKKYEFPTLGYISIPKLEIPADDIVKYKLTNKNTSSEYLRAICREGFKEKLANKIIPEEKKKIYADRIKFELEMFEKLGFVDYILLIYRIVNFCKENGILNSPARGSCGGSLAFYCVGVTKIDPIKHDLLFERFISAERAEIKTINGKEYLYSAFLADVDIDSDATLKYKINDFIEKQFPGKTAPIITFGTFQSKVALKECLKCIEEAPEEAAKRVSEMVSVIFGKVEKIEDCIKENKDFKKWSEDHPLVISVAQKISGLIKNTGLHAAGIIICEDNLIDTVPLQLSSDKRVVCGFEMNDAQLFGIKVDNLGLKNLRAIKECLEIVDKKMEDIDVNDPSIYQFLYLRDQYYGIFQAEEGLGKKTLKSLECQNVDEVANSLALGRPGCMKFSEEYIKNKKSGEVNKNLDKRVANIFNKNYGTILFQEDIMALSREMAKFTPAETNALRKFIGKKDKEKLKTLKEKFIKQSVDNNFDKKFTEDTWQQFEDCGDYLFCKSHGIGYGYLTAITVYLKANHPKEFFLSLLRAAKHEAKPLEEISKIQQELKHFNLMLLPPDILKSEMDFSIQGENLRYGLASIKGVSDKTIEKLNKFKHEYSNKFEIFHGANEAGIDIRVLCALIKSGTIGGYNCTRSKIVLESQTWNILSDKEKSACLQYGPDYEFDLLKIIIELNKNKKDEKGKPVIKDSRFETIKKKYLPYKEIYLKNKQNEKLTNWFFEHEMLGFSHSTTITEIFREKLDDVITIEKVKQEENDCYVRFVGKIIEAKKSLSKKNKNYLRVLVEDDTSSMTCLIFNEHVDEHEDINGGLAKEGDIVVVRGKKKDDCVFADRIATQKGIITKIGQTEKEEKTIAETEKND